MFRILIVTFALLVSVRGNCRNCRVQDQNALCEDRSLAVVPDCLPTNITYSYLKLNNNNITSITAQSLQRYPLLETLITHGNKIRILPEDLTWNLPNLVEFRFSDAGITSVSKKQFIYNSRLRKAILFYNMITSIDRTMFLYNPLLEEANFYWNNLTFIPTDLFVNNPNLLTLSLSYNQLSTLDENIFMYTPNLNHLRIEGNNIRYISPDAFTNLKKIIQIDLGYNKLTSLSRRQFRYNPELKYLLLSGNKLVDLPPKLFSRVKAPLVIYIESTPIDNFHADTFQGSNVKEVNFMFGNISNIDPEVFSQLPNLKTLVVMGNPWHCDCALKPFADFIVERSIDMQDHTAYCKSPENMFGRPMVETVSSLDCTNYEY